MRVLIVGCGYVGQAAGAALARQGHAVDGFRRSPDSSASLTGLGIRPVVADITRPDTLAQLPPSHDAVILCVSSTHGGRDDYRRVYVEGSQNLLRWLAQAPQPPRLVYTSSTSVYGQTDGEWVDEESPTDPGTETGIILLEAERLLLAAGAVILRVAGIYGPGRGYWLKQFLAGEARLQNQGERFLNMVHRDDVAGAAIAALNSGRPGRIYNVVDNEPVTQGTLFEWLAAELHQPAPPSGPASPAKRGSTSKRISNRRLRDELAYQLEYPSFREGFRPLLPPFPSA